MASTEAVRSAWSAYRASVHALFTPEGAEGVVAPLAERGVAYDQQSAHLETLLAEGLRSEDRLTRERYTLALLKASAHDLEVANALIKAEQASHSKLLAVAAAAPQMEEDLFAFPGQGGDEDRGEDGREAGLDRRAARQALEKAIDDMLQAVPKSAADQSLGVIGSIASAPVWAALGQAAPRAAHDIIAHLPAGLQDRIGVAIKALGHYIAKAIAFFGPELVDKVRTWVTKQLEGLKDDKDRVVGWIGRLYDTEHLGRELRQLVEQAGESVGKEQFRLALQEVQGLKARYEGQTEWTGRILTIVGTAQGFLLGWSLPWGPIIVGAIYAIAFGYIIYIGGDYLDWHRTDRVEWIDFIDGLRKVVRQEIS